VSILRDVALIFRPQADFVLPSVSATYFFPSPIGRSSSLHRNLYTVHRTVHNQALTSLTLAQHGLKTSPPRRPTGNALTNTNNPSTTPKTRATTLHNLTTPQRSTLKRKSHLQKETPKQPSAPNKNIQYSTETPPSTIPPSPSNSPTKTRKS